MEWILIVLLLASQVMGFHRMIVAQSLDGYYDECFMFSKNDLLLFVQMGECLK